MNMNYEARVDTEPIGVEDYTLPRESDWQDIEDVPEDFRQIVELHMMAQRDGDCIEDVSREPVSFNDVCEVYDSWAGGQRVLVVRDDMRSIVGMLSYYIGSSGLPFLESVGVDPAHQGEGMGATLIDAALEELRTKTTATHAVARAQRRVLDIYARRWGAEILEESDDSAAVKIGIPIAR